MSEHKKLSNQIKPLIRLHDLRIKRLEETYRKRKLAYQQAVEVVEQRKASIENLKLKRSAGFSYLQDESIITRFDIHTQANTHRYWLEYDLEKDEYYLPEEEREMDDAQVEMNSARKLWLRARNKKDGMEKKLKLTRGLINRELEQKQELEIEEAMLR